MSNRWPPPSRYTWSNHAHDFAMHMSEEYPEAFGYLLLRNDEDDDRWIVDAAVVLERDANGAPSLCANAGGVEACGTIFGKRIGAGQPAFSVVDGCHRRNGTEDSRTDVLSVGLSLPWARHAIANAPGNRVHATVSAVRGARRVALYGAPGHATGLAAKAGSVLRQAVKAVASDRYRSFTEDAIATADHFAIEVAVGSGRKRTASKRAIAIVQSGMKAAWTIAARQAVIALDPTRSIGSRCAIFALEASVTDEARRFTLKALFAEMGPRVIAKGRGRGVETEIAVNKGALAALAIGSAWQLERGLIDPVEDLEVDGHHSATLRAAAIAKLRRDEDDERAAIAAMLRIAGSGREAPAILAAIGSEKPKDH